MKQGFASRKWLLTDNLCFGNNVGSVMEQALGHTRKTSEYVWHISLALRRCLLGATPGSKPSDRKRFSAKNAER